MFSSNSSGFEKDLASTRVYDQEELVGQASLQLVQAIDEFDLEQSCLIRLKTQRQKIQQLTKIYQEKEKQIIQRAQHEKKLMEEIEKLSDLTEYKQSYTELKRDYEALVKKQEISNEQFQALKRSFDEAIISSEEQTDKLKGQIKLQKEQRLLAETNWQAIVADRDEQLRKQTRKAQERESELTQKIAKLEEELEILQESLEESGTEHESTSFKLRGQLKIKQEEISNYDKLVECMRKQISDFRAKMVNAEDEWQKEKEELCEVIEQLKTQVKLLRRDQSEKENEIYEVKQILRRCDNKNQNLEDTVNLLKTNLKKTKDSMGSSIRQLTSSSEEEKGKLQMMIQQLKAELEVQMDEKGALALEVKRLRSGLERREQQQKQRKLLLMSEFREIDKMEKVVKRII